MNKYSDCPRCGSKSLERLKTYAHCANCFYAEDYYLDLETSYFRAARIEREVHQIEKENQQFLKLDKPA